MLIYKSFKNLVSMLPQGNWKQIRSRTLVAVSVLICSAVVSADSSKTPPPGLANIAVGKPYKLSSPPNYALCTDPDDVTQLTDGAYATGRLWIEKGTVGWSGQRVFITIDLGKIETINGLSYSTAAGVAGVALPEMILVMVSDDDENYRVAGDLVELSSQREDLPAEGQYAAHRLWTDRLAARGRYVRIGVESSGPYTFCDEIEIYGGSDASFDSPVSVRQSTNTIGLHKEFVTTLHIRQRLYKDLASVREITKGIEERKELESELNDIERMIPAVHAPALESFRTTLPLNDLHRRIFTVQASAWRAIGLQSLIVWQKNCWDMLDPMETPQGAGAKIDMGMMQNERRSTAFNMSNAGTSATKVRLSFTGLPGGSSPKFISVYDVTFTDTKSGEPVAAALPVSRRDGNGYLFEIEPGMTKQIWMTFDSKNLTPGEFAGKIVSEAGGISVPIYLKVYPIEMPKQMTLHLGGWDYTDSGLAFDATEQNRTQLVRMLQDHFVDTPWATGSVMPTGSFDKDGTMVKVPDSTNFKAWVDLWPDARNYLVFSNVGESFGGLQMGTPQFKRAVTTWINWWVKELAPWNIQPEQLGLLLVDEPHSPEQDRIIVEYGKVINEAQPKVVIWEDPTWTDPLKANQEMFAVSSILSPQFPMWIAQGGPFADFYIKQRDAGKELWFYSCSGPGKLLDPYSYYRMQQWFCWKHGAKGSCFWSFGDSSGASTWNEYIAGVGAFTPVFLDANSVTNGKHMEAIREGVQDYEYLRILRDRIAELQKKGTKAEALEAAQRLLATAADRVLSSVKSEDDFKWKATKDRSIADQVRREILEALTTLQKL